MAQLRPLSQRPELIVGQPQRPALVDPAGAQVGVSGAIGRARVLFALPLNKQGPMQIGRLAATAGGGALVGDPDNNVIGGDVAVWVSRMLYATPTADAHVGRADYWTPPVEPALMTNAGETLVTQTGARIII
jgi:hypothetical protein